MCKNFECDEHSYCLQTSDFNCDNCSIFGYCGDCIHFCADSNGNFCFGLECPNYET